MSNPKFKVGDRVKLNPELGDYNNFHRKDKKRIMIIKMVNIDKDRYSNVTRVWYKVGKLNEKDEEYQENYWERHLIKAGRPLSKKQKICNKIKEMAERRKKLGYAW